MGASGSAPATPAAPRNKHLAHVSDPRSPTAGILRTPIEVVSSPAGSPQLSPAESLAGTDQERDPRSPTPGISRTPMRAVSSDSVDRLVKQLSEAFGPEAAGPAEEPARRSSPPSERPPSPGTARPGRPAGHGPSAVSKPVRPKPNNKFMATPGGTGRSPLSILRDDNSPSAPAPRQGKRHVLVENLGEKKEVDLSRSLKSGNYAWSDLNKENQQCPFVEN
ncbi:cell division cycle-associated protein 3 isoform X2 [Oenanthe melanoleuca]|uniref:cell division cycle-associated protein 3 isoform X2 n=1 Tax=Oenanthe melanoleuca TaxID=2939378 RepID=UPI0024C16519|nr:cell division cycle-associated protein 3 isoform X2 [Oenanthe melanoleuca]